MSDKLQFVMAFGSGLVSETSDKLKFVGHFQRPFALLSNTPTVSGRRDSAILTSLYSYSSQSLS